MNERFSSRSPSPYAPLVRAAVIRLLLFVVLWVVLTEGRAHGWGVASLAIGSATIASLSLRGPEPRWSIRGLLRFIPFFLLQSVRGGVDVALRAFHPALPIDPGVEEFRSRLPTARQRAALAAVIGLFPGTLAVRLDGERLSVHSLNRRLPVGDAVREVEARLANLFRAELTAPKQ